MVRPGKWFCDHIAGLHPKGDYQVQGVSTCVGGGHDCLGELEVWEQGAEVRCIGVGLVVPMKVEVCSY